MSDTVLYEVQDAIATITLNRPESLNAMDTELLDTLVTVGRRAAEDPEVRCVVITGAGRAFCAGGDVKGMAGRGGGEGGGRGVLNGWGRLREQEEISRLLHEMPKPTIAAINGPAAGAGMSVALAADFRIMSDQARIVPAFAKVAFSGDFGGTWFLQRLVGIQRAREIYMLAEPITPEQALADRIVNKVVPHERLDNVPLTWGLTLVFGFTIGNVYMMQSLLVGEVFGMVSFGAVFGMISLAGQVGSGGGPLLVGGLEDLSGGYTTPFVVTAALTYAAALAILLVRPVAGVETVVAEPAEPVPAGGD